MIKSVAVITISDTCSKEENKDTSGPTLVNLIENTFPQAKTHKIIVPDDSDIISTQLIRFSEEHADLILTTGGTGLTPRDVTPEATRKVIEREVPAITVALTLESLKKTPMAMLSRAVAGVRDSTLIINFPGSKKAVIECFEVIKPILSHAIALIKDETTEIRSVHNSTFGQSQHVCPHNKFSSNVDMTKVAFRPRESPYAMMEMSEAFRVVDEVMKHWTECTETISIEDSLGRVVAVALYAKEPMPPFPASVKDGYACLSADGAGVRHVREAVTAGDTPPAPLSPGECIRINTGAALPAGADCVVQVEDTKLISATEDGQTELEVEIMLSPQPNQDVRPVGFDIPLGTVLADIGEVLDAGLIGVLAGAGHRRVTVRKNPKVALLSTGNELQDPMDEHLRPAHIRDSNKTMLKILLKEHGYESIDCGIARDEPNQLVSAIAAALQNADILVCTGGVSMGERDLLKPVLLNDFGATLHFGRVRMKPGKPSTFATCHFQGRMKYIFALPGNPVSAYVCCLLLVVRALRACAGGAAPAPGWPRLRARLSCDVTLDARPEYARASLELRGDEPTVTLLGSQCSSRLLSARGATVLLELPGCSEGVTHLPAGTIVPALITGRLDRAK